MVGSYSCVYHIVYCMLNSLVQYLKHDWVQTNKAFVESVPGISIIVCTVCIVHTYIMKAPVSVAGMLSCSVSIAQVSNASPKAQSICHLA